MVTEKVNFLKLSTSPVDAQEAVIRSGQAVETFLDKLDSFDERAFFASLLDGTALIDKFGKEQGRELAAHRLVNLMNVIGGSASKLADVSLLAGSAGDDTLGTTDTVVALQNMARDLGFSK